MNEAESLQAVLRVNKECIGGAAMERLWVMRTDFEQIDLSGERTFFDAGSGRGIMSFFLMRMHPHLHGTLVDVDDNYKDGLNIFFPDDPPTDRFEFIQFNLHQKQERTYDLVLCMDVLEHIVYWKPVVRDLWNQVSPGGYLYIQTPSNYPSQRYPLPLILRTNLKQRLHRFVPNRVGFDGANHVRHGFSVKQLKDYADGLGGKLILAKEQYIRPPGYPPCRFKPRTSLLIQKS